jgi:hypothetical protein
MNLTKRSNSPRENSFRRNFHAKVLEEITSLLPEEFLEEAYLKGSEDLRTYLDSRGRNERKKTLSKIYAKDNSRGYCSSEGTEDVFGALIKAAEGNFFSVVEKLQERCTARMFSVAAAHAALKGHLSMTKLLYSAGSEETLETIVVMAVLGGAPDVVEWAAKKMGVTPRSVGLPKGVIGRNVRAMLNLGLTSDPSNLMYGIMSFGSDEDLSYVAETIPSTLKNEVDVERAFLGALENRNDAGVSFLRPLVRKENPSSFLISSTKGNYSTLALDYARRLPGNSPAIDKAICIALANGNLALSKALTKLAKRKPKKTDAMYAAYSGRDAVLEDFSKGSFEVAVGAAAGGNWDYVLNYVGDGKNQRWEVVQSLFTEAISHSQLSILNNLYEFFKDRMDPSSLRGVVVNARRKPSLLVEIAPSGVFQIVASRVDQILS